MDVLPKLFKEVKKRVPQARLKWCYGWTTFDLSFKNDKRMMEWRNKIQKECDEAGIESLGKIPQAEAAKLYQEGAILAYPTEFYEIDCISVKKAQKAGCLAITTDFAALGERNITGITIHSNKNKDTWSKPYQFQFAVEDERMIREFIDVTIHAMKNPPKLPVYQEKNSWKNVAETWHKYLCE
jgi:glycosyltransferase involved in cell wall biosynthesis